MWIKSRSWDFLWILSPLWVVPFLTATSFHRTTIGIAFIVMLSMLHLSVPVTFGLFFTSNWKANEKKRLGFQSSVIVALIILLLVLGLQYHGLIVVLLPSILAIWATWHFYRQDLGILSLYRSKAGIKEKQLIWFDRLIVVVFCLINPLQYWFRTGYRYFALKPYLKLSFLDPYLPWGGIVVFGCLLYVAYLVVQLIYGRLLNPRTLYVTVLFCQFMTMTNYFHLPKFYEYYFRIFCHNLCEIGLQTMLWKHVRVQTKKSIFYFALGLGSVFGIVNWFIHYNYKFIGRIVDNGVFDLEQFLNTENKLLVGLFVTIIVAQNLLHFFLGRHIYNFSQPEVKGIFK